MERQGNLFLRAIMILLTSVAIATAIPFIYEAYFIEKMELYSDEIKAIPMDEPIFIVEGTLVKNISIKLLQTYVTNGWRIMEDVDSTEDYILIYQPVKNMVLNDPSRYMYIGKLIFIPGDEDSIQNMYRTPVIVSGALIAIGVGAIIFFYLYDAIKRFEEATTQPDAEERPGQATP